MSRFWRPDDFLGKVGQTNMWCLSSGPSPHDPQLKFSFSLVLNRRSPLVMMFWARLKKVLFWLGARPLVLIMPSRLPNLSVGPFLISFDQDRCAMLDRHMGDAPLQDDLLPLLGGEVR